MVGEQCSGLCGGRSYELRRQQSRNWPVEYSTLTLRGIEWIQTIDELGMLLVFYQVSAFSSLVG